MAIAFDTTSSGNGSTTYTFSHTCTGSNRLLVVATTAGSSSNASAVSYNGTAMTLSATRDGGYLKVWTLLNPTSGANNVSVTTGVNTRAISASWTGVAQSSNPDVTGGNNTGSAAVTISNSITTLVNNSWVIACGLYETSSNTLSAGSGATNRTNIAGSVSSGYAIGIYDSNGPKTPVGSYSMTLNVSAGSGIMDIFQMSFTPYITNYPLTLTQGSFSYTGYAVILAKGIQYGLSLAHTTFSYTGYTLSFILDLYTRVTNRVKHATTVTNRSKTASASVTNRVKHATTVTNRPKS